MSERKVLACPFCGEQPECGVDFFESRGSEVFLIATVQCKCGTNKSKVFQASKPTHLVPFSDYEEAFEKAIELWNRRVPVSDEYEVYG